MSDIFRDLSFGGYLRELRIKREFTLRQFSKAIGLDSANYSRLERSLLPPPRSTKGIDELTKLLKPTKEEKDFLYMQAFNQHIAILRDRFWNKEQKLKKEFLK